MNGSLRAVSGKFPASMTEHLKGNTYTNLIYACNSLLRKFSQISNIPKGRVVFRGLSGVTLPDCFEEREEGGGCGGVDYGFLSTTTKMEVAVSYLGDTGMPVLFMFEVGDIDRGASLSFLSQYPNEEEILIPPLSYLEVVGEPFFMETDKGDVKVYRARINCNLKSQTIEEIVAHRQKEVLAMLPYLDGTLRRDVPRVAAVLIADLEEAAAANVDMVIDLAAESRRLQEKKVKLDELQAQILREFEALCADLAMPEKMSWLNEDGNYKQIMANVVDFRHHGLTRLVKAVSDRLEDFADPRFTGLHVAAAEGRVKITEALLDLGAPVDARDLDGWTALMIASGRGHTEVVGQLLDKGADVNANNEDGRTALIDASSKGRTEVVRQLLDKGADVNAQDKDGQTALMCASENGHTGVEEQLLGEGADLLPRYRPRLIRASSLASAVWSSDSDPETVLRQDGTTNVDGSVRARDDDARTSCSGCIIA